MKTYHRGRALTAAGIIVLAAALLAACGSSSHKTSSSSAASASGGATTTRSNSAAPAGAPIKVGMICSCSGIQAANLALTGKVASAWANSVNAAGGINGHPVHMTVLDDGGTPATALQDAKKLVEQDHVVAIVGEYSLADAAFASYVASKGIPVVGGITPEAPFLTNPDFYPSGANIIAEIVSVIRLAKATGRKFVAVPYCAESPICAQIVPLVNAAGAMFGVKITTGKVSSTAPNYTAPCISYHSKGVDGLFVGGGSTLVERFATSCAQQGYRPTTVNTTSTATGAWRTDHNLDGAVLSGYGANVFDDTTPATKEFRAALAKYYPGILSSPQFGANLIGPWAGGKLFEAAAKAAHLGPQSTSADVKKGLYALKGETLGGLSAPLTFTPGKPTFTSCYFTVQLKNGNFVSLNGNRASCLPPNVTTALMKALHLG
jgi:branched-chain amino acid transport system substrate-binding protein